MNFRLLPLACLVLSLSAAVLSAGEVTFQPDGDEVVVSIDGKEFARYETGEKWPKPFFHPVLIDGTDITRPIDANEREHPHHKGLWVSVDEVNKIKFWAEKGKIENISVHSTNSGAPSGSSDYWRTALARYRAAGGADLYGCAGGGSSDAGEMKIVNHWVADDGSTVVEEHTRIRIYPDRLMIYDITFKAPGHEVVFEDTKEGLLGFRMAHTMRESEGGHVTAANGVAGTAANWGKPNKWIDYYGEVGGKTFGVTLMDHPDNFRPSRYHVRNYGLFSISPFGEKAYTGGKQPAKPVHLSAGESLRLRYGVYFHTGDTEAGGVKAAYEQFLDAE